MIQIEPSFSINEICDLILDVPDFPKKGINFKDITPILANADAFRSLAAHFAAQIHPLRSGKKDCLVAIESRGFLFACSMAPILNIPVVLARKPGKLPRKTASYTYDLEYGTDTVEIHADAIAPGEEVFIIDDVLATGGTAHAVETLCRNMGADVKSHHFLMELSFLEGGQKLSAPYYAMKSYTNSIK
ncbi:MAG: adenine phosphoribosyltransferase [Bdellovibrionales bacterium]|nr:adenine phosphoribosyltransferase [Bdellovibrionales bacterium]